MRKCTNISPYMRRPLVIFDFATAQTLNLLIYEGNLIFFFISVQRGILQREKETTRNNEQEIKVQITVFFSAIFSLQTPVQQTNRDGAFKRVQIA
jgi:hypothetical protein